MDHLRNIPNSHDYYFIMKYVFLLVDSLTEILQETINIKVNIVWESSIDAIELLHTIGIDILKSNIEMDYWPHHPDCDSDILLSHKPIHNCLPTRTNPLLWYEGPTNKTAFIDVSESILRNQEKLITKIIYILDQYLK